MPRLLWLADAARTTGYPVVEVSGWRTRGVDTMNPHGTVNHHTGGLSTGCMPSLNVLINGRSDLPGPLAHYGISRCNPPTIYVIASGRANHAGAGGWRGLTGNSTVIATSEMEHTGARLTPWPATQLDCNRRLTAEVHRRIGRDASWHCLHKEWAPTRKVDPVGLNGDTERALIAAIMEGTMPIEAVYPLAQSQANPNGSRGSDVADLAAELRDATGLGTNVVPGDGTWPASMAQALVPYTGGTGIVVTGNAHGLIRRAAILRLAGGTSGGVPQSVFDAHVNNPAGHAHRHPEGTTGQPVA